MEITVALIGIILAAALTDNIVFAKSVGICPLLGVSKKMDSAIEMGLAVIFINTVSAVACFAAYKLLMLFSLEYLKLIAFILINATIIQSLEVLLKKFSPTLYSALGVYLSRLITANCVIFLTVNTVAAKEYVTMASAATGLLYTAVYAFAVGVGFLLAVILMAAARSKEERGKVPRHFRGFPIALITAGLMALVFSGFLGFSI